MFNHTHYTKQKGYSLIELSVVFVILGLAIGLGSFYANTLTQSVEQDVDFDVFVSPERALQGFVYANNRLPCPASDLGGVEDCTLSKGFFPHQSVGLAKTTRNSAGSLLAYAIYNNAQGDLANDAALGILKDRNRPFVASSTPPVAVSTALSNLNQLDLCQAVYSAKKTPFNSSYLHISDGTTTEQVAYIIADPGGRDANNDGNKFDGLNVITGSSMSFEQPNKQADLNYDDFIKVGTFDSLWEGVGCSHGQVSIDHGYANAVSAVSIMNQATLDYEVQVKLAADIAGADIAVGVAGVLSGVGSIAAAAATLPIGSAEAIVTAGALAPSIALAATAIGLAAAGTASAAIATGLSIANKVAADKLVTRVGTMVGTISTLKTSVHTNEKNADSQGF